MVSVNDLINELKDLTRWQVTPEPLFEEDYFRMVKHGIRRLYVDTNRPSEYDDSLFTIEPNTVYFNINLNATEKEYVMIVSQIDFFKRVQADVNNRFGYSTDALTITNADKPYANLRDTIGNLENERRIIYYKMTYYALGS